MFRLVCIVCVFLVLNLLSGCTSKPDMVADQDIIELYNDNTELFERTAEKVKELEKKFQPEIRGLSFRYEEHRIVTYIINTQISFYLSDDVSSDLKDCFIEMDSIINEAYDEDEYVLWIANSTKSSPHGDVNVTQFGFSDDVIGSTLVLTYSEDKPGESDTIINENWYISWSGQV